MEKLNMGNFGRPMSNLNANRIASDQNYPKLEQYHIPNMSNTHTLRYTHTYTKYGTAL